MRWKKALRKIGILEDDRPIGIHRVQLISRPEELDNDDVIPTELHYIFKRDPAVKQKLRTVLAKKELMLGLRTTIRTPDRVVRAIDRISHYSQHAAITTWLPALIKQGKRPLITPADKAAAKKDKIDLEKEITIITSYRQEYKRVMFIHQDAQKLTSDENKLIERLNKVLEPVEAEFASRTMVFDSAHARTEIAQAIIKSMLFVGPIAHVLEHFARGWGKVFAASIDDIMSETAEFFSLRASGFAWSELWKRALVLIPVFIAATWALLHVEHFIQNGQLILAGIIFGIGAVALSLTTAVQSIFMFHKRIKQLQMEGKVPKDCSLWREALAQDFTNPARFGLFLGALASPIMAAIVFTLLPNHLHNGWLLALLGTTETIVAGLAIIYSRRISALRFRRALRKMIRS